MYSCSSIHIPALIGKTRQKHAPRDPLLRHNSIDDEMTFSGLNKKTDIPSKTFMKLTRISNQDGGQTNGQQQCQQHEYDRNDDDGMLQQSHNLYIVADAIVWKRVKICFKIQGRDNLELCVIKSVLRFKLVLFCRFILWN